MLDRNLTQYAKLSPFELKDQLIEIALFGCAAADAECRARQSEFSGDLAALGVPEPG